MAKYVGFRVGKVYERNVISEYYCGGCGCPVTDHDSFCSECGGALRECDASDIKTYEDGYRDGYADGFAEGRHFADDMLMDDNRQLRECLHAILDRGEAPERETSR